MAKGKIRHWKHGWIPLDAYARAIVAKKQGQKTFKLTDAPTVDEHKKLTPTVKTVRHPRPPEAHPPMTKEQKRVELNKRRAARGELPIPPRAPRKPANWVPPADNVPKWKAPSAAERDKIAKDELTKAERDLVAARKKRAQALKKAGPPSKVDVKNGVFHVTDDKGTVLFTGDGAGARAFMVRKGITAQWAAGLTMDALLESSRQERYRKVTTVDGVDFVSFNSAAMDPLGLQHGEPREWTPEQMQIAADAFNEVKAEFPKLQPVQFVATKPANTDQESVMGITSWDGRRISLLPGAFTDEGRNSFAANMGPHGGIAGQFTDDPEAFSRSVVVHELGHALQMQKTSAKVRGEVIAREKVTPDEVGIDTSKWERRPAGKAPRWAVDTLNRQSMYALGNEYEWFAEAFAEGWFNGDKATPEGKRVLALLHSEYGKAAA